MLGWSIKIMRGDEHVLSAESKDLGLDAAIRERAVKVLQDSGGYPNQYLIRNDQLPRSTMYTYSSATKAREKVYQDIGPFHQYPRDEILWVELWDQS